MSIYKYKFINNGNEIESIGFNLFNAAENIGIRITRADRLGTHYLQKTKFEDRVRTVWGISEGSTNITSYEVHQKFNK